MKYAENEEIRGCGRREIGGYYLVCGSGLHLVCDALPLKMDFCDSCGYWFRYGRGMSHHHAGYLRMLLKNHKCKENYHCPLCSYRDIPLDGETERESAFFMFVSKKTYSKKEFIQEAFYLGVSKRIAPHTIPKDFKIGRDWVFLVTNREDPEIFYAFKPSRIEIVLAENEDPEKIAKLKKKGFTVVLRNTTKTNKYPTKKKEEPKQ